MWEVNTFTYNIYIFTLYIIGIYSYYLRILFISIVYCLLLIIIDNIVVCFRFTIVSDFFFEWWRWSTSWRHAHTDVRYALCWSNTFASRHYRSWEPDNTNNIFLSFIQSQDSVDRAFSNMVCGGFTCSKNALCSLNVVYMVSVQNGPC